MHIKYRQIFICQSYLKKARGKVNRFEYEKNFHGRWSFSIYTKENDDRAEGSPRCKCCLDAFKSLNLLPLGRKEENYPLLSILINEEPRHVALLGKLTL